MNLEQLIEKRQKSIPLTCISAHTYPMVKIIDQFCDIILVGDSVATTIYGQENTLSVSLQTMIDHAIAVKRAIKNAFLVVDLPYGSYEKSKDQALENAKKVIADTGCHAIKIETDLEMIPTVQYLIKNNIQIMGHVGLMPQHIKEYGGYKYQGTNENSAQKILETAIALEESGSFATVIEAVPKILADQIMNNINKMIIIAIGASVNCDGQILVIDDLLGLNPDFHPKFLKKYHNLAKEVENSVKRYQNDVIKRKFPADSNCL